MTAGIALDALTVECPTCRAQVRAACYYAPQPGTWWPRDPHPTRIEAARALLLSVFLGKREGAVSQVAGADVVVAWLDGTTTVEPIALFTTAAR